MLAFRQPSNLRHKKIIETEIKEPSLATTNAASCSAKSSTKKCFTCKRDLQYHWIIQLYLLWCTSFNAKNATKDLKFGRNYKPDHCM